MQSPCDQNRHFYLQINRQSIGDLELELELENDLFV